jgi:hypothetical protein
MEFDPAAYKLFLDTVQPRLVRYESLRSKIHAFRKSRRLLFGTAALQILAFFNGFSTAMIVFSICLFVLNITLVFFLYVAPSPADTLEDDYKNDVLRALVKSINPDWKFNSQDAPSAKEFLQTGLYKLPNLNKLEAYDHVFGLYHNNDFTISLLKASETSSFSNMRAPYTVVSTNTFFGLRIGLKKTIACRGTHILFGVPTDRKKDEASDFEIDNQDALSNCGEYKSIATGDSKFDTVFQLLSSDVAEAKTLIDIPCCNALLSIRQKLEGIISISIKPSGIFIHAAQERNLFSFDTAVKIDEKLIELNRKELVNRFELVEILDTIF